MEGLPLGAAERETRLCRDWLTRRAPCGQPVEDVVKHATADEVETEIRAQVERALQLGFQAYAPGFTYGNPVCLSLLFYSAM